MTHYSPWKNVLLYQLVWFGSVLMQNYFVLPTLFLLAVHFYWCQDRRTELVVVFLCATFGLLGDMVLTTFGVYAFEPGLFMYTVPLWLLSIWVGFATTLRHGLSVLLKHPPIAVFAAGVGAPIVYLAAERLGAVHYPFGGIKTASVVSLVWMLQMCLMLVVVQLVENQTNDSSIDSLPVS